MGFFWHQKNVILTAVLASVFLTSNSSFAVTSSPANCILKTVSANAYQLNDDPRFAAVYDSAVIQVPSFHKKSIHQARQILRVGGWNHQASTDTYETWIYQEPGQNGVSKITFRLTDGRVTRNAPKIFDSTGQRKYSPRISPDGQITVEHDTGERVTLTP